MKTKRKQPGRPPVAIKKGSRVSVRFSTFQYYILKAKARSAGVNISEYLRQVAIEATINSRLSKEEVHFVRQLAGISNNMNQVAKIFNQQGLVEGMKYFEQYREQVDSIFVKLKA